MGRTLLVLFLLITLGCACATKPPAAAPSPAAPVTPRPSGSARGEQPSSSVSGNTTIRFDASGVDFNPWLSRFIRHVRRNWFVPYAATTMRGHVVVTFYVHKDGRITDLSVLKPSAVDAFTHSARHAIAASNPTIPLPEEYPDDRAFFTLTFYFNENP